MVYGDLQFFDIIVFAGIAAFLIYRLRNVLGKRGGFEKQIGKPQPKEKEANSIKNIPQLKENENKLSKAYDVLEDFDHKNFLEGAKFAFETIINAFNNSDKKTLKNLLTKYVFLTFEKLLPHIPRATRNHICCGRSTIFLLTLIRYARSSVLKPKKSKLKSLSYLIKVFSFSLLAITVLNKSSLISGEDFPCTSLLLY